MFHLPDVVELQVPLALAKKGSGEVGRTLAMSGQACIPYPYCMRFPVLSH